MRIKICIDIWRDVFDFLPTSDRKQIARKSNRINDREFSDLLQKWLHEWTKNVRLGPIVICSSDLEFLELEMPDNIRDFTKIHFSYLDSTVISFLRRMQLLFHDKVNLDVQNFRQFFFFLLTLTLHAYDYAVWALGLIERIRQQLITANCNPVNFLLICFGFFDNIQESTTHNTGTNEQLVIRKRDGGGHLLIGRCPSDVDGQKWVEKMAQEARETEAQAGRKKISISDPKLGPFEEAEPEEKEKAEEDAQPGPSKQKQ